MDTSSSQPDDLRLLSDYLDDALAAEARHRVEQRLAGEPDLAAQLADLRAIDGMVASQRTPMPPLDWDRFRAEVRERVAHVTPVSTWWRVYRFAAPLAAAAVLVLVATVAMMYRGDDGGGTGKVKVSVIAPPIARPSAPIVRVSRRPAQGSAATVLPIPRGRTLIVTVGDPQESTDDTWDEDVASAL